MGGRRFSVATRVAAVEAFCAARRDRRAAVGIFNELVTDPLLRPTNPSDFIPYWYGHFVEKGSVLSTPPPGQPPLMPNSEADECLRLLRAGYRKQGGARRYFRSVRQALRKSAALKALADKHGYCDKSLLRRLKARDPHLHRSVLRYRRLVSGATKRQRLAYCQMLAAKGAEGLRRYLARVVWLDAKLLFVVPKSHLVYAPRGAAARSALLVADRRLPGTQLRTRKIHYYAAVNLVLGACHFKICSGTTGYKEMVLDSNGALRLYTVGAGACAPAS